MCRQDDRLVHCEDVVADKLSDAKRIVFEDSATSSPPIKPTYRRLIADHPNYRWFILSYICTNCGEWLTYVACMSLLEHAQAGQGHLLITMLIVARLVSFMAFSFVGGILADSRDRKQVMLVLDAMGVVVALMYLRAQSSVGILFGCAILQSALAGLYEPSRSSILPLLVDAEYIEKANEIGCVLWSLAAAIGSTMGGFIVARYGVAVCFVADSLLYLVSALILATKLKGTYNVLEPKNQTTNLEPAARKEQKQLQLQPEQQKSPGLQEMIVFLGQSEAGWYIIMKFSGALMYGAASVLNVTFSQVDGILDSQRLGWMFAVIGVGSLVGPLVMPEGRSYLYCCVASILAMGLGYAGMGWTDTFWITCVWTAVKAAGSAILWVDSTILLQTTTPATLLGRISAADFALATLGEALSAVVAGELQDRMGLSADHVAYCFAVMGIVLTALWMTLFTCRKRTRDAASRGKDCSELDVEMKPLHDDDDDDA